MKLDLLTTGAVSRKLNDSLTYQLKRGRLTALLLLNSMTWHFKDKITVKLRHEGGLTVVCDRVPAYQLAELTDMKQGKPSTGTPNFAQDDNGDDPSGFVFTNPGQPSIVNAILLPIGHITLSGAAELEITCETERQDKLPGATDYVSGVIKIAQVIGPQRSDTVLTYEMLKDLETTQSNVRELYLSAVNGISFFVNDTTAVGGPVGNYPVPKAKDIIVRIDNEGEMGETDVETHAAMTAITGELSTAPNGLVRVFQEHGSLPATVGIKVFGSDSKAAELLVIREISIPHLTSQSLVNAIAKEQVKAERLEASEPERYKALVQNGTIKPVETLEKVKDSVKVIATPQAS